MAPESSFDVNKYLLPNSDLSSLTPEQKQIVLETRAAALASRNQQLLTSSISGSTSLDEQYTALKTKKNFVLSTFNEIHNNEVIPGQSNYSKALSARATQGWAKLKASDVFSETQIRYNTMNQAFQNLSEYGDLKGLDIGATGIYDSKQLKGYVSNQQFVLGKQYKLDSENYENAQVNFSVANSNVRVADRYLTSGIDKERTLVDEMRFLDEQMRMNIAQQNWLG